MQPSNLMDYHLHTAVTIDGRMTEAHACERALSLGIHEIAFTNHVMLTQPDYTITPASLLDHLEKIRVCQDHYTDLTIRLGVEMGYYPNRESEIATTLDHYAQLIGGSFDLVLGAIHDMNGVFFSNKNLTPAFLEGRDLIVLYRDYFELATRTAQSHLFNIIAHPDLIKKYTNQLTPFVAYDQYSLSADSFIAALVDCGVGIEVNTKGLNLPVNESYPSVQFLLAYLTKAKQVEVEPIITFGSDAHKVEDVGFGIKETAQEIRDFGLKALMIFDKRVKSPLTL